VSELDSRHDLMNGDDTLPQRNRSAGIRIPMDSDSPKANRLRPHPAEFGLYYDC